MITLKPLPFSQVFLWLVGLACMRPVAAQGPTPFVGGYVQLDGKPLANAEVVIGTLTARMHAFAPDVNITGISPRWVELTVESTPGGYVAADWSVAKNTDKSGHFQVTPPADILRDAPKFFMMIHAVAFKPGWTQKSMNASVQAQVNGACLYDFVQASFADARYNLISTRTGKPGGCLGPKDIHPNDWSWWYNPPPLEVFAPFLTKLWDASLEGGAVRIHKGRPGHRSRRLVYQPRPPRRSIVAVSDSCS